MKKFGNIFLAWRKGKESHRIIVGVIKNNSSDGARFSYIEKGVNKAKKLGFTYYEGFPDISKEYTKNVIDIFGQRIIRSKRNDIADFYNFWQIDEPFKDDNLYMLAYTQGLLPTDSFEFLADFNPEGLSFISEIEGLSKSDLKINSIKQGDELTFKLESNRSDDKQNLVKLYKRDITSTSSDKDFIGYIKKKHCSVFKATSDIKVTVHRVEQKNKINRIFIKISRKD